MEPLEQLLGSKSHLIIGQKFEIMLDIISVFWEIWLDIVLNISFFWAFGASFRLKITLDYRPKNRNCAWYYRGILGLMAVFLLFIIKFTLDWLFFWEFFLVFSPRKRIFCSKSSKNWKSKNGVKTALTQLFKELWANFGFVKFKNQIY